MIDVIEIKDKEKAKTIKLSQDIWKRLTQYRLDTGENKYENAVDELLKDAGY